MGTSGRLKQRFLLALLALFISLTAVLSATFAWYIFNANSRTTRVHMAAGTTTMLEISNAPLEGYSSSTLLSSFNGRLNPVSTNNLHLGFRKVTGFITSTDSRLIARLFNTAQNTDFYCTTLYLRSVGGTVDVYLSDVSFEDSSSLDPISSAVRMGLVVHAPGKQVNAPNEVDMNGDQFIIEINPDAHVREPEYNTYKGEPGHVLDLSNPDTDATAPFTPLTPACYCRYDRDTGIASTTPDTVRICTLSPEDSFIQVDVYIWLEGCDPDCTRELASRKNADSTLKDLAISFAGIQRFE